MTIRRVPLTHYGTKIGYATIDDEGITTFVLLKDSQGFGSLLASTIDKGLVEGLSISPITVPPKPYNSTLEIDVEIVKGDVPLKDRVSPNIKPVRF